VTDLLKLLLPRRMDEEDIDNETLQATVNASLARINDLVSSWVKPPKPLSSNSKDAEKEIEQLLHLPPRYVSNFVTLYTLIIQR
jgi:hypothetical protein